MPSPTSTDPAALIRAAKKRAAQAAAARAKEPDELDVTVTGAGLRFVRPNTEKDR